METNEVVAEGSVAVAEPVVAVAEPVVAVAEPVVAEPVAKPKKAKAEAKAKAKAKAKKVPKGKRGRGRPPVFTGNTLRHIVSVIRKHGLTGGRVVLAEEGTKISLPTLGKFAAEAGIELHRGRPKKSTAKAA